MFCKECGNNIIESAKFCGKCGKDIIVNDVNKKDKYNYPKPPKKSFWRRAVKWLVVIGVIVVVLIIRLAIGTVSSPDYQSTKTSDSALESFDAGNSDEALSGFSDALNSASERENKLQITKNIGYVLASEGRNDEALAKFKEALSFVGNDAFERYLVSGEIALLEGNYSSAEKNYLSAYKLKPNEFQINNALTLFYLDLEGLAPGFEDYKKALTYALATDRLAYSEVRNIAAQNLAIAYYFNENYQKSIEIFSGQNLSDPLMSYWLGLSYAANGNTTSGLQYLKVAAFQGIAEAQDAIDYINSL